MKTEALKCSQDFFKKSVSNKISIGFGPSEVNFSGGNKNPTGERWEIGSVIRRISTVFKKFCYKRREPEKKMVLVLK